MLEGSLKFMHSWKFHVMIFSLSDTFYDSERFMIDGKMAFAKNNMAIKKHFINIHRLQIILEQRLERPL